jgi:addiction module RelE/StbE family toxin
MARLNWTEQSKNDLISIAEFIAQDSIKFARITVQNIRTAAQQLKKYPQSGRVVPETQNSKIRELIYGNYRIVYWYKSDEVIDILTIHHAAKHLSLELIGKETSS